MKWLLFTGLVLFSLLAIGQIPTTDQRKIQKILGEEYTSLPPQKSYVQNFDCIECSSDTSVVIIGEKVGAIANGEFILFHNPISFSERQEVYKSIRNETVSTEEYTRFENWVRDSTAMERVFWGKDIPYFNEKFIIRDKKIQYFENGKPVPTYNASRYDVRSDITFDRNYVFDYSSEYFIPLVADLYLPQIDQINRLHEFDKRKYFYTYNRNYESASLTNLDTFKMYYPNGFYDDVNFSKIRNSAPIMRSEYEYAKRSIRYRDEMYVLGSLGVKIIEEHPVYGIKSFQADAFCDWKQSELQREFDAKKLNYQVVVTLPTKTDSDAKQLGDLAYTIPARNYTDQWKITNNEYKAFVEHVYDSVIREVLFFGLDDDDKAIRYLKYEKLYFNLGGLEFYEFDKSDRDDSRYVFYLNYSSKIKVKQNIRDSIFGSYHVDSNMYKYYLKDASRLALEGSYSKGKSGDKTVWRNCVQSDGDDLEVYGKSRILESDNVLGEINAIRVHVELRPFIQTVTVHVLPENQQEIPDNDDAIQTISYEQALAFYNWKYPIHLAKEGDDWQNFVVPSKEEFHKVQRGEQIQHQATTLDFPGTTFRYVVHVFPKFEIDASNIK